MSVRINIKVLKKLEISGNLTAVGETSEANRNTNVYISDKSCQRKVPKL